MNILFTITEDEPSYGLWHALNLAQTLFAAGHDVRAAIAPNSQIADLVKETKIPIESILSVKTGFLAMLHQRATFKALNTRWNVDFAICYGEIPSGLNHLHNANAISAICEIGEKTAKKAKRIIAPSRVVADHLVKNCGAKKDQVFVVRGGLDPLVGKARAEARERERKRLKIDENNVLIGITGRLDDESGHKLLLQALTSDYHKNLKFISIAESADEIKRFMELCRQFNIASVALAEERRGDILNQLCALDVGVIANANPNGVARRAIELAAAQVRVVAAKSSADSELANAQNVFAEHMPNMLLEKLISNVKNDKVCDRASVLAAFDKLARSFS